MRTPDQDKSIGLITYHYLHNYGAVLQAYALSTLIRNLGYACQIIDFRPEKDISRLFTIPNNLLHWPSYLVRLLFTRDHQLCRKRFETFIKDNLVLTECCYSNSSELRENPPFYDTYVCGSDQIWHPNLLDREFGLPFLLSFSPQSSRRVAYAPSFGIQDIPERYKSIMAEHISRFDALSVRERVGQKLVMELVGKPAELVLDPTLLLKADDYLKISVRPKIEEDYILVYPMETGSSALFVELVRTVKKKVKLPLVFVFPSSYSNVWLRFADQLCFSAGPCEFLGLIAEASFVVTNSFHGTALSVLFNKPFLGTPHSSTNTRISNLLEILGLSHRQLTNPEMVAEDTGLLAPFDYAPVQQLLDLEVQTSVNYLRRAL